MATLLLSTVGSAAGSALGGPIGAVGRVLGAAAGALVDRALVGGDSPRFVEGPRLTELDGLASSEGAAIPRVYGRARIGGQLIWATRFEEVATTAVERSGGRGGKSVGGSGKTVGTTYAYFANLAIGLCEGPIGFVRRVWADGRELDLTTLVVRVHRGDETQPPDPLIVAKEGADNAPAYRGLAYVVFERLPLESFGNRVPQFSFEVARPVDGLAAMIRAVCLIPGASEFGYETSPVMQAFGFGVTRPENRHQLTAAADVVASLDALQALCPNLRRVSLVVSWFGDDLRAGHCTVAPRVESAVKVTQGAEWSAAGLTRASARIVSQAGGAAAYGGTPSDASVVRLIRHLKDRGLEVGPVSLCDDGRRGRQRDAGPLDRRAGPAGLSLARAHHLRPGARTRRHRRRERCGGDADRGVLRHGGGRRLRGRERGGFVFRPRRVELPPAHPALRASRASRRRGRRLHHRQRARRADARALRSRYLSGGRAALHACRRPARRARPRDQDRLRGRLDRIRRPCARWRRRGALPARSAVVARGDRRGRHRFLPADRRLARRRRPRRPGRGAQPS